MSNPDSAVRMIIVVDFEEHFFLLVVAEEELEVVVPGFDPHGVPLIAHDIACDRVRNAHCSVVDHFSQACFISDAREMVIQWSGHYSSFGLTAPKKSVPLSPLASTVKS